MKIMSITSAVIQDVDLYPYQEQTIERIESNDRSIIFYGRQMGLTHTLCSYTLDCLSEGKTILFLTLKNSTRDEVTQRINLNVFGGSFKNEKVVYKNGKRNFVKVSGLVSFLNSGEELDDYDVVIVDNAINISDKYLREFMEERAKDFKNKLILASSGSTYFDGFLKELYRSKTYKNIVARRFIHPSFSKDWKDTVVAMMGLEKYRLEYECRGL